MSKKNIIVSGFGGQGVLFLGNIISEAAIFEDKNTTWIPSYGAEMRGGAASCYVIVSDNEIDSPVFDYADFAIFLSKQAKDRFEKIVNQNGVVFANSSMTDFKQNRADIEYVFIPFNDLIAGKKLLLNIVALGAFIKKTKILAKENVIKALEKISSIKHPEFLEINLNSFEYGYTINQ